MSSSQTVFADDYLPPPSPPTSLTHAFSSNITLAAIVILACVVFLIALLHFYAQCLLRGRRPRSALIALRRSSAPPTSSHTGLDAATIAKLPTFTYTASVETGSSRAPLLECAVCLCEFQENEKGRTLPACKHAFHIECIDMWFLSHSTCPLCRTVVLPTAAAQADAQQQQAGEQGAGLQASLNSEETPALGSTAVQLPCNVLFWGNTEQITSLRETSSSPPAIDNSPTAVSGVLPQARRVPQVAITIPAIDASVSSAPVRDVWSKSARFQGDQATTSSQQALRSPGLRASLKKILSRQSSWHTAPSHEGSV